MEERRTLDPDAWRFEPSPRTTMGAPGVADVQRLIAAAESTDPVLASAIALGAVTAARRGELCALRWS